MAADPTALIAQSACFNSCIPTGMQLAVMNYLLYQIALNGTGGGGGGASPDWIIWEDSHADDNPPAFPLKAQERRFRNGDTPVIWDPNSNQWL